MINLTIVVFINESHKIYLKFLLYFEHLINHWIYHVLMISILRILFVIFFICLLLLFCDCRAFFQFVMTVYLDCDGFTVDSTIFNLYLDFIFVISHRIFYFLFKTIQLAIFIPLFTRSKTHNKSIFSIRSSRMLILLCFLYWQFYSTT